MATQDNGTDDNTNSNQTDENSASATDKKNESSANQQDDQVVLSKEDYQNLVSKRDQNFDKAQSAEEKLAELESWKEQTELERARDAHINSFIKENKDKYPHVKKSDLRRASSPEEVEEIAQSIEDRYEEIRKETLAEIQDIGKPPVLTPEEKAQKEEELRKRASEGEDVFAEWIELNS